MGSWGLIPQGQTGDLVEHIAELSHLKGEEGILIVWNSRLSRVAGCSLSMSSGLQFMYIKQISPLHVFFEWSTIISLLDITEVLCLRRACVYHYLANFSPFQVCEGSPS